MGKVLIYLVHGLGVESAENWWGTTKETLEGYFRKKSLNYSVEFKYFNYRTKKSDSLKNKLLNFFGKGDVLSSLDDIGKNFASVLDTDPSINDADCVILFCHSMGGLVAANALVYVNSVTTLSELSRKITHIIFCGTPLGGSNLASRARYLPYPKSSHVKELLKDSCSRQIVSLKLKEISSLDGVDKTNISFIKISEDEVVKDDMEIYGVFFNQLNGIETPTITGAHSKSVQNINDSNAQIIVSHIQKCIDSEICRNRSRVIDYMGLIKEKISECNNEYLRLKSSYKDNLVSILIRSQEDKIRQSAEENNFIDLKILYRKTFLSSLSQITKEDPRKVILDINRKIKVINSNRDVIIGFYAGFAKVSDYANKTFIDSLMSELKSSMNTHGIDRFKNYALKVKKKEGSNESLLQVHDVQLEYCDTKNDTIGFNIEINIGRYAKDDEVELFVSYTLPTTIWLDCCKHIPDTIILPATVLESEVIIQEEIYNGAQPMLSPRVVRDGPYSDVIEDSSINLYYKTYKAKKFFHHGTQPNDPFKVTVEMEHQLGIGS